jgi:hypothetical protein
MISLGLIVRIVAFFDIKAYSSSSGSATEFFIVRPGQANPELISGNGIS